MSGRDGACREAPRGPTRGPTRDPAAPSARPGDARAATADGPATGETCDYCGSTALSWRKCKLVCANCSQINKSCADL